VVNLGMIDRELNTYPERIDSLKNKEIWDLFNKGLTWFFAINVGTLLWVLSNFEKFIISDGSMPNKNLYMLSIILLGFSSLLLAGLQGISFWYQHKNIRYYTIIITNLNSYMRGLNNLKTNLYNALNQLDSNSLQESLQSLDKSDDSIINLEIRNKDLNKLFDKFEKSYVFSWPASRLAFGGYPILSVPKLPVSS
jgi:hypothetical protein